MDLDKLKGATLDDKTFGELKAHIDGLAEQRDAARKESIDGRKQLKTDLAKATERVAALEDWAGIDAGADISALPAPKGQQSEAVKQAEAKLARVTRERDEAIKGRDEATGKVKGMTREAALASALEGQRFKNPADVRVLLQSRVVEEGDDLLFKTDDGKLVPLKDGAAWFAKTRPDYVEAAGNGGKGSGFKGGSGGDGGSKAKTRAEFDAMSQAERLAFAKDGGQVVAA